MSVNFIMSGFTHRAIALGIGSLIAVSIVVLLGRRFLNSTQNNNIVVPQLARDITPLVDRLDPRIKLVWDDFVSNKGVFTVPGTSIRMDLAQKQIQAETVDEATLKQACQYIQGNVTCTYNRGSSQDSKIHHYYRQGTTGDFVHIPPGPNNGSAAFPSSISWEDESKKIDANPEAKTHAYNQTIWEILRKDTHTVEFTVLDCRPAGVKI